VSPESLRIAHRVCNSSSFDEDLIVRSSSRLVLSSAQCNLACSCGTAREANYFAVTDGVIQDARLRYDNAQEVGRRALQKRKSDLLMPPFDASCHTINQVLCILDGSGGSETSLPRLRKSLCSMARSGVS
jgi:hypothetical protein